MAEIFDLTHRLRDNMPAYPGDNETRVFQSKHLDEDGYNNYYLKIGMHSGTHIDTPMHLTSGSRYISDYPLDRFVGEGCVIDVRGREFITMEKEYHAEIQRGAIVLFCTGHSRLFGTEEYFKSYPVLEPELADFLISRGVKMVGLDSPSPDRYPFTVHKKLLGSDILIAENLTNLQRLLSAGRFEVLALPLNIEADSSIARVAARLLD